MAIDFHSLYEFADPLDRRFFRGSMDDRWVSAASSLFLSECRPDSPIRITQGMHGILADIVWTDHSAIVLISERLNELLRSSAITGFSTYSVDFRLTDGTRADYVGLAVSGRCGPPDYSRGEWVTVPDRPGRFLKGLYFDEDSWSGDDFFLPQGTHIAMMSAAVKTCLETNGIRNYCADPLSDYLMPELVLLGAGASAVLLADEMYPKWDEGL